MLLFLLTKESTETIEFKTARLLKGCFLRTNNSFSIVYLYIDNQFSTIRFTMSFSAGHPNDLLFDAARKGDVSYISELIIKGIDVNIQNAQGFTPLVLAVYAGHLDASKVLLAAKANVNGQDVSGNTALMGVSFKGNSDIARLLIERGADVDLQNDNGSTALMFATQFGHNQLVKLLLDYGADMTIQDNRGLTARDLAIQKGNQEALQWLD